MKPGEERSPCQLEPLVNLSTCQLLSYPTHGASVPSARSVAQVHTFVRLL